MDIPRKSAARKRRLRRILYITISIVAIAAITVGLSRLKPAAPGVEASTLVIETVKRGLMLRQVRGLGTLVPEEIRWIPATTDGRVERILLKPGAVVKADTVLLELSNPEVEQAALEAEMNLKAAEAEYTNLKVQLDSQLLTLRSQAASVQAEYRSAQMQAEANEQLVKDRLISELIYQQSKVRAAELATRYELEHKRLEITAESTKAQLAVQQARVEQLRALLQLRRSQVDSLRVRSGIAGVLQEVPVQVGQRVSPGTNLARVADPTRLKAEIRIAETQAKDIQVGQVAFIDTRPVVVEGRLIRIDPAVRDGTVLVDVALDGPLPKGARPDLSVDGTIEIERLEDVIYVGRPAFGQEKSTVGLFKLINDGQEAVRVRVKLGRSSVNTIEVVEGLQPGDRVIISDMSQWDSYERVRLSR